MHELAICQALLEQVERIARDNGAQRVVAVVVAIGPLAGVEPALLQHAYPIAAAGTLAEHATLQFEVVPLKVRCRTCSAETEAAPNRLLCGACQDWQVTVISTRCSSISSPEITVTCQSWHAPHSRRLGAASVSTPQVRQRTFRGTTSNCRVACSASVPAAAIG